MGRGVQITSWRSGRRAVLEGSLRQSLGGMDPHAVLNLRASGRGPGRVV